MHSLKKVFCYQRFFRYFSKIIYFYIRLLQYIYISSAAYLFLLLLLRVLSTSYSVRDDEEWIALLLIVANRQHTHTLKLHSHHHHHHHWQRWSGKKNDEKEQTEQQKNVYMCLCDEITTEVNWSLMTTI